MAAVWLALWLFGVSPPHVNAELGAQIDLGAIRIDDRLQPGDSYRLPDVSVSNPGDERGRYTMNVTSVSGQVALTVDAAWVGFAPASFVLEPGESQDVEITMALPSDATAGDYQGLLGASVSGADAEGGASVGATAAARLTFSVGSGSSPLETREEPGTNSSWLVGVLLAAALLVLLFQFLRRFRITVEKRQ